MKIGVRAHDYGKQSPEQLARTLHDNGYECAQLALPKAIEGIETYADITPRHLDRIRGAFEEQNVEITVFGCYMDLSNPDGDVRKYAVDTLKRCLSHSKAVGAKVVGTETSYAWLNAEEKGNRYPLMIESLLRVVEEAARLDVKLAVEPVYLHPMDSLETTMRVIREINDDKHLRMIFDASNLLQYPDTTDQDRYWSDWLGETGKYIEAMHIKDFLLNERGESVPTALGKGVMRYGAISQWLHENRLDMPLLREEMDPANAQADIAFLRRL